nr:MAG TPA: hypothetical protein [Caudoviricetes sp.]
MLNIHCKNFHKILQLIIYYNMYESTVKGAFYF